VQKWYLTRKKKYKGASCLDVCQGASSLVSHFGFRFLRYYHQPCSHARCLKLVSSLHSRWPSLCRIQMYPMVALLEDGVRLIWNRTTSPEATSVDRLSPTGVRTSAAYPMQPTSSGSSLRDSFDGVNDMPTGNANTPQRSRKRWSLKLPTNWIGRVRRLWTTATHPEYRQLGVDVSPFADPVEQQELSNPFASDEDSRSRAASIPPRSTDRSGAAENWEPSLRKAGPSTRSRLNVKIRSFTRRNAIVPSGDAELVVVATSSPRLEGQSKPDDFNAQLDTLRI
jgi:hypothetical protein